jgi:hypothetical protein
MRFEGLLQQPMQAASLAVLRAAASSGHYQKLANRVHAF